MRTVMKHKMANLSSKKTLSKMEKQKENLMWQTQNGKPQQLENQQETTKTGSEAGRDGAQK